MDLLIELDARRREAGNAYVERIEAAARWLDALGIPEAVRGFGDTAPDFGLPTPQGSNIVLSSLLRSGPVVLSFYRGEWCPFCRAELDALLGMQPKMAGLGATLVMISPEGPSERLSARVAALGPQAHLLNDSGLGVALTYGLVYRVPDDLRQFYIAKKSDLSRRLSARSWLLPLPADFVVDTDGAIVVTYVNPDFTRRLDPSLIVERLEELVRRS